MVLAVACHSLLLSLLHFDSACCLQNWGVQFLFLAILHTRPAQSILSIIVSKIEKNNSSKAEYHQAALLSWIFSDNSANSMFLSPNRSISLRCQMLCIHLCAAHILTFLKSMKLQYWFCLLPRMSSVMKSSQSSREPSGPWTFFI